VLEGALERGPFAAEGGRTGAAFERAVLADGTPVVLKHVSRDGLFVRITGEADRLHRLWKAGFFDRVPGQIDHATMAVEPSEDGWVVVMRDVSRAVFDDSFVLSREESRRVLSAVDAMHREFIGERPDGVASLDELYSVFLNLRHLAADFPIAGLFARGWELFPEVAPADVADVMSVLLQEPGLLARELSKHEVTVIHGDLRLHNLGLTRERVVLLDWEIVCAAPSAVEFAWYLIISATRIDATREEVIDDFRAISAERFDPRALEIALVGGLACLGWNKALDIVDNPDPAVRAQERADLDWWIARVRRALETWSPV
jgi:hypothetical protein